MNRASELRQLVASEETLVMPDAYDPISARIIQRAGYAAIQCSGASISIAACLRAESDLTLADNLEVTGRITRSVSVPVMADGENGYGDPTTTAETVRRFVGVGAAGINIEDQVPAQGRDCRIVDRTLMLEKIASARSAAVAAGVPELVINARTDALRAFDDRSDGIREAIERANIYLSAGADLAFVCYAATLEEVKTLAKEISGPISIAAGMPYNIHEFSIDDLRDLGVARVSLPVMAIMSALGAITKSLALAGSARGFERIADDGTYIAPKELSELLQN